MPQNPVERSSKLEATPEMCHHCFDVLIDTLKMAKDNRQNGVKGFHSSSSSSSTMPEFASQLADASVECPIFVTWNKRVRDDHWQLRGCIGTLSPRLLVASVGEYALISALRDRRFSPITMSELTSLRVSVSLLVNYEECKNVYDWTVGVHGILIKFQVENREYSATYLPDVAMEQGWDPKKTVSSLIQKAGYHGPVSETLLKSIKCTRYQSTKCQVTFGEYVLEKCQGKDPLPKSGQWNSCNNL